MRLAGELKRLGVIKKVTISRRIIIINLVKKTAKRRR